MCTPRHKPWPLPLTFGGQSIIWKNTLLSKIWRKKLWQWWSLRLVMNMLPMFSMQRLKVDFCTGSGLEPGGHYVHEGTTLLSHQQLRGRLGGEVSITTRTSMMMTMMSNAMWWPWWWPLWPWGNEQQPNRGELYGLMLMKAASSWWGCSRWQRCYFDNQDGHIRQTMISGERG